MFPKKKSYEKFFEKKIEKFWIFSKTFCSFRSFENFSRNRSRRDDSFGPKIVEFRAILAIFRPIFFLFIHLAKRVTDISHSKGGPHQRANPSSSSKPPPGKPSWLPFAVLARLRVRLRAILNALHARYHFSFIRPALRLGRTLGKAFG